MFIDFYDSWNFLNEHGIYKDKAHGISNFQNCCLCIDVVKVNPETNTIEDDKTLNTKTQVWLESGSYEDEHAQGCHDCDLDCGADTFENAIIELANLVFKKFGT